MTELIWDGKYGPDGKKTRPVRVALPFQDVETVNESAQTRNLMLDLFARNQPAEWRNRLIWGDKKYVLPSLLPEFAGKVDLIYIDPPYKTDADFSFTASIPDDPATEGDQSGAFVKRPSMIEQKAYRDTWGRGMDGYLQWFYETVQIMHELLNGGGSIYVHCDWRVNYAIRHILDEVFSPEAFRNEIVWIKNSLGAKGRATQFPRNYDTILFYTRDVSNYVFHRQLKDIREPISTGRDGKEKYPFNAKRDEQGRYYWTSPPGDYSAASIAELDSQGRIERTGSGKIRIKYWLRRDGNYLVNSRTLDDAWDDVEMVFRSSDPRTGYDTQKPEALLERIIQASSNEGDLVLDCFAGSGTTAAVAEKLNRRWITADLGRFSIHTTRKRLLAIPDVRPFVVQNLGKYERQAWQVAAFTEDSAQTQAALAQARYRQFILDLYHATPIDGYNWLHGVKAGHYVHVGSVDAPILDGDVRAIAQEFWKVAGKDNAGGTTSVDVLGWDFAFAQNELGRQMADEAGIAMTFKRIPRDVMDRRAVVQGEITFFELAALSLEVASQPKCVAQIELCDFIVPADDVPQDVQQSITHWSQYIDYWAIDWNYRDDTFHNQWQSYRTKKQPRLELAARHSYDEPGTYTILVKVIDILGNDTTRAATVEVKR